MATMANASTETAMSAAFRKVGKMTAAERLQDAALDALGKHGYNYEAVLKAFYATLREDVDALWELTERMAQERDRVARDLLREVQARIDAERARETVSREADRAGGAVHLGNAGNGHDVVNRPACPSSPAPATAAAPPAAPTRAAPPAPSPRVAPAPAPKPARPAAWNAPSSRPMPPPPRKPGEWRNPALVRPKEGNPRRDAELEARLQDERRMRSKLWSLPLEGNRVLAHFTGLEAKQWAARNLVRGLWVREAAAHVPDTMLMMHAYKGDAWEEVERIYERAVEMYGAY